MSDIPNDSYYCHPHSLVETANVGSATRIWAFVHILRGAIIGDNCNICDHCFIENDVTIGDNVTIKCGVYLWDGIKLENDVFVGPNVVFTNDVRPRSKNSAYELKHILVKKGASLGANSTILAGVIVGKYALIGIGSVVTRDVPDFALVYGNPAKQHGWVNEQGDKLALVSDRLWAAKGDSLVYEEVDGKLTLKA